ncbi:MAG: DNA adenine methylase [Candidatus Falkowbacteria bacterium]
MSTDAIYNIAVKLNVHPIHVRLFLTNYEGSLNDDDVVLSYKKYVSDNPKPFVKWVGGKRQLLKQFREMDLYPPDDFDPNEATYFEPFVGGGAMFFDLLPKYSVLSDMNLELVTSYNVIKNNVGDLIKTLKEHQEKNTKEYFLEIRALDISKLSDTNIAARFIYLNRTGFNGLYRVNSKGKYNVPYGDNKNPLICDEENLKKAHEAMKNTKIFHQDYKIVLEQAKKGDFIYFDPPYYPVNRTSSFTSYTKEGFLEKEQEELKDSYLTLHKRGCYVMLSNSDTEFINNLYSGLDKKIKIHKVFAGRAINSKGDSRGRIKEVVIINY